MIILPLELDFHLPAERNHLTTIQPDQLDAYSQLVCWCLVQRYWYYVLNDPQVVDKEYDEVESLVQQLEREYGSILNNQYSPSKHVGSGNCYHYPRSLHTSLFNREKLDKHYHRSQPVSISLLRKFKVKKQ